MATTKAVGSFWTQLAASGLISDQRIEELVRDLDSEGTVSDLDIARELVHLNCLTRFQAYRLLEGRSRGFFFDEYKLLDLLGVGGMGWVYRAVNTKTGDTVALKVLLDQFKHDHGLLARFEQEARAGLRFDHENIIRTLAYGAAGGLPYMTMEYVEGPSLLELLRLREKTRLHWEQACDIARQAANGLHHLHQSGFVHRDVKPQNLLIDHAGHVKILDFGLSMFRDGESGDEFSMAMIFGHECVGTAGYTAPEQATDSLTADARSDIYSLGCTLYAALTGDTPFPLARSSDVLKAHQSQTPRNVCDIVPSIPKPVGDIVAKMLEKRPKDRFATAEDVANHLSVWSKSGYVEFDFDKILADRTRLAREKLTELSQRQRRPTASGSTAKPATISSVASASSGEIPVWEDGGRSSTSTSSAARRDPFGLEHSPTVVLRKLHELQTKSVTNSANDFNSRMVLVPINGGKPIRLIKERFLIGRAADCDMQIQDASVSSRHCELQFDGDQWMVVDLKSRNGVRVNGELVKKQLLQLGDTIHIGATLRLRFDDVSQKSIKISPTRIDRRSMIAVVIALAAGLAGAAISFWQFAR